MKKVFFFFLAVCYAVCLMAAGTESLKNAPNNKYYVTDECSFTGDNGQTWTLVGATATSTGGYRALKVSGTVSNNGLTGKLSKTQTDEGIGTISFYCKGALAGTGYGDRTFRVKAGTKTMDVKVSIPSMSKEHLVEAKIDVTGASAISITMLEAVSGETAQFFLYNFAWTSFSGKTDTPTFATTDDFIASGTDTIYYAENNATITLNSTTPNATFYYTTNGSNPTTASVKGNTVSLPAGTHTVKCIAVTTEYGTSEVATKQFKIENAKLTHYDASDNSRLEGSFDILKKHNTYTSLSNPPMFQLNGSSTNIITDAFYNIKGLSLYAFAVGSPTLTIAYQKGIYLIDGNNNEWVASGSWTTVQTLKQPQDGKLARYEIMLPQEAKSGWLRFRLLTSGSTIYIDDIHAIAEQIEQLPTPVFSIASGKVNKDTKVTISSTSGATIHYAIDGGAEKTATSPATVAITSTCTLTAYATQTGKAQSWTRKTEYTVSGTDVEPKYPVVFYDEDGTTVLYQTEMKKGEMPEYKGETPTKKANIEYTYAFNGWSPAIHAVTGTDDTYKATYKADKQTYTITFVVEGKSTQYVLPYGAMPEYEGGIPEKPADGEYTYVFEGWQPEIVPVNGNATYTAVFTPQGVPTDLEQGNLEQGEKNKDKGQVRKVFENGHIYILLPDGRKMNALGTRME